MPPTPPKLSENYRTDRLSFLAAVLLGVAVVTVILGIVAAIWFAVDRDRQKEIRLDKQLQQTAQKCIEAGNIWVDGKSCVVMIRPE